MMTKKNILFTFTHTVHNFAAMFTVCFDFESRNLRGYFGSRYNIRRKKVIGLSPPPRPTSHQCRLLQYAIPVKFIENLYKYSTPQHEFCFLISLCNAEKFWGTNFSASRRSSNFDLICNTMWLCNKTTPLA